MNGKRLHGDSQIEPIKKGLFGPDTDLPVSDVGTGEQEISWEDKTYTSNIGTMKLI